MNFDWLSCGVGLLAAGAVAGAIWIRRAARDRRNELDRRVEDSLLYARGILSLAREAKVPGAERAHGQIDELIELRLRGKRA